MRKSPGDGKTRSNSHRVRSDARKFGEKLSRLFWPAQHFQNLVPQYAQAQSSAMNSTTSSIRRAQPLPASTAALALIPLGVLINLGIGTVVHVLKLPVFIDAV